MRVDQLLEVQEVILDHHPSIAMNLFVKEMSKVEKKNVSIEVESSPLKRLKVEPVDAHEDRAIGQRLPTLVFGLVGEKRLKQYGLRGEQLSKVLVKQIEAYVDHMIRPINMDRQGAKIKLQSAMEHRGTFFALWWLDGQCS
jgi:hypothetical protein